MTAIVTQYLREGEAGGRTGARGRGSNTVGGACLTITVFLRLLSVQHGVVYSGGNNFSLSAALKLKLMD